MAQRNRFYSMKCSDGAVKNFTRFASGEISLQIFRAGERTETKLLKRKS